MKRAIYVVWLIAILYFLCSCTDPALDATDPVLEEDVEGGIIEEPGEEEVIEGETSEAMTIKGSLADYKVKPGDILNIDGGRIKEINMQQARVDDKGFVKLPYVGRVKVLGLTKWEVEELIEEKYKPYFKNLKVVVEITNLKYTIGGEVKVPGQKGIIGDVRLTEAIQIAGGYTSWAKKSAVTIRRKGKDGKVMILKFNCEKIDKGDLEDPFIIPDDIINVPR